MIFGSVRVSGNAVETHRDTYLLSQLTVISVRRPCLAGGIMFTLGLTAFGVAFGDLLYLLEIALLFILAFGSLAAGLYLGQIQLLSRDLRGSELSCMIWGSYEELNQVRQDIFAAMDKEAGTDRS
jgi:hypothetical protein